MFGGLFSNNHINISSCPYAEKSKDHFFKSPDFLDAELIALNKDFLTEHRYIAQMMKNNIEMVIIYKESKLSLWKKTDKDYEEIESAMLSHDVQYVRYKMIAHIPVYMEILLDKIIITEVMSENTLKQLENIQKHLSLIKKGMTILSLEDVKICTAIIDETNALIESLKLLEMPLNKDQLNALQMHYHHELRPIISCLNQKGTEVQLTTLNKIMASWSQKHQIDIAKSRTIIVSGHGPRNGLIEAQYFTHWYQTKLNVESVKDNFIYNIESLPSKTSALNSKKDLIEDFLLGAELNKMIGKNLLGSEDAMSSDLLKAYAPSILGKMF